HARRSLPGGDSRRRRAERDHLRLRSRRPPSLEDHGIPTSRAANPSSSRRPSDRLRVVDSAGAGLRGSREARRRRACRGKGRRRVGRAIVVGLDLLLAGAILVDESHARPNPGETQEALIARENLRLVWGPAVAHIGMFLFVIGLISAAVFFEELDIFVRLFLVILSFLAVLLILAGSTTIFGVP